MANYFAVTFLLMYGVMWFFDLRVTTQFFVVAACMLGFMRVHIVLFFSNGIHDLALYLSAEKRLKVTLD